MAANNFPLVLLLSTNSLPQYTIGTLSVDAYALGRRLFQSTIYPANAINWLHSGAHVHNVLMPEVSISQLILQNKFPLHRITYCISRSSRFIVDHVFAYVPIIRWRNIKSIELTSMSCILDLYSWKAHMFPISKQILSLPLTCVVDFLWFERRAVSVFTLKLACLNRASYNLIAVSTHVDWLELNAQVIFLVTCARQT